MGCSMLSKQPLISDWYSSVLNKCKRCDNEPSLLIMHVSALLIEMWLPGGRCKDVAMEEGAGKLTCGKVQDSDCLTKLREYI